MTARTTEDRPPLFGEIAVRWGYVSEDDVQECLRLQEQTGGMPIGELLVERGLLQADQVQAILREQVRWWDEAGDKVFGRLAVTLGWASEDDIEEAVEEQREKRADGLRVRLGEILVDRGILTSREVAQILDMQKRDDEPRLEPNPAQDVPADPAADEASPPEPTPTPPA